MTILRFVVFTLLVIALAPGCVMANDKYSGSPAARAEFDKGKVASQSEDWKAAVAAYKKAIQLDPNFAEAYQEYWLARTLLGIGDFTRFASENETKAGRKKFSKQMSKRMGKENFKKEYQDLVRRYPDMPIYRWALAQQYLESNPTLEEKYCTEAVEIDPAFGPGYDCIAAVAGLRGDTNAEVKAFRKNIELNPEKTDLLLTLQREVRSDPTQFEAVTREIVSKFPATDTAVEALDTYAETLPRREQITKLEEIVANYPPSKFHKASEVADRLLSLYDSTDPAKAADFAHKMLVEMPGDKEWKSKVTYVDSMAAAESKIAANDGNGALAVLKDLKVPGHTLEQTRLQLLKAKAQDSAGNTLTAYTDLVKIFAEHPVREVQPVLYQYGKKLGKTENTVNDEVWNTRRASAKIATPFSLESFIDGKKVSLDDYKGKVVLLDFWFPNCGPCRQSMPYLQALWTKYKDSGLVFLGVNGVEGQADFVMPLVKSNHWGMIPLRGSAEWCTDVYKVRGYPTTFLIGADGRVYFRPDVDDSHQYDMAEMQIEALLAVAKADNKSRQSSN